MNEWRRPFFFGRAKLFFRQWHRVRLGFEKKNDKNKTCVLINYEQVNMENSAACILALKSSIG
jgi:hypothetical protein